ncbi:hypothetical protein [Streptomyces sp. SID14515]|uniref:hypothetical protein n=1 Tax=Streptomyces sp. SID14515 TaxID=2706074 RepID=UPI0013C7874D|nr:hypothetical protein [Streptomyces sp. SID14515]NEB42293.1 hypothetical protein [Streptomyces sp. SID14515]
MNINRIVEPGRYDYSLTVKFPSTYIPEHTPPEFRNAAGYETTRTRSVFGQFDLAAAAPRDLVRDHFVRQVTDELLLPNGGVEVVSFTLEQPA